MKNKLKRVYVYKHTKEKIENWVKDHEQDLPYISKARATFPLKLELYIQNAMREGEKNG
jgi:hypothetical protein